MSHRASFPHALDRRQCVSCPVEAPACNCAAGQQCHLSSQSCDACASAMCVDPPKQSSSSGGVSKGALAGAAVGVIILLVAAVFGYLYWRKRTSAQKRRLSGGREKNATAGGLPLGSRPNTEYLDGSQMAVRNSQAIIGGPGADGAEKRNLRPESAINPFLSPSEAGLRSPRSPTSPTSPNGARDSTFSSSVGSAAPARPSRSPEVSIRNSPDYIAQMMADSGRRKSQRFEENADGTLQPPRRNYEGSVRSGFTDFSVDSTASSAMDELYEPPTIVTARIVNVSNPGTPMGPRSPNLPGAGPRRSSTATSPGPSPLNAVHTVPVVQSSKSIHTITEESFEAGDPFADQYSLRTGETSGTTFTFGMRTPSERSLPFSDPNSASNNRNDLQRTATMRSMSAARPPSSQAGYSEEDHPLRDGSTQQRISYSSSVRSSDLESYPFVPATASNQGRQSNSPRSIRFFNNADSRRTSAASHLTSFTTGDSGSSSSYADVVPPLPTDSRFFSSSTGDSMAGDELRSPTTTMRSNVGSDFPNAGHRATGSSAPRFSFGHGTHGSMNGSGEVIVDRMSKASVASTGLGAFDFHFAAASDAPAVPPLPSHQQHPSSGVPPRNTMFSEITSAADFNLRGPVEESTTGTRASLDVMELSRDLEANRLPY